MKKIAISLILMIIFDAFPCKKLASFAGVVAVITSDDEIELIEAVKILNKSGGTIYINTPIININRASTIELSGLLSGGITGEMQPNGTHPVIDFKNARNHGSTSRGFTISGSNITLKRLIIQNAGGSGIWVSGSRITLDHIITRYNGGSGIQLSDNADSITLNYCYSYRNIDIRMYGANADGFTQKFGASNTVFNYCFAWDNSVDGWGSYDREGDNSANITYLHSACWNNGNPQVFNGKYDYDNKWALDKNMRTIQYLMSSDVDYESNFNKGRFAISSNAKIDRIKYSEWMSRAERVMKGNGFKFGSWTTQKSPSVKRTADYCIAFDHKSKGFDNNNSEKCTGYITNCASFNNKINYQLPYTFASWSNNWSWNPIGTHQIQQKQSLKTPKDKFIATRLVYNIRDRIISNCKANKFIDTFNFDNVIKRLS